MSLPFQRMGSLPGVWAMPAVEAQPGWPLPDAGVFLRVFSGAIKPSTVLLRCAVGYIGIWQVIYEQGRNAPDAVHEQLALLTFAIDHEAGGHTREIPFVAGAPMNPSSYGEMVSWLSWKYLLTARRQDLPAHREHDAAQLVRHIEAFDRLVGDVQAGRVRLPERATEVYPPRTIRANTGGQHGRSS
ncbi:hypothetical protein ACFYTQ_33400 [Nocardia sp. NPDC004068]|uniref:hypothetical protein n=1 Tax=Nocardia sp. NPDC004068 TaxID=3364303 RepID=UPI00369EACD5